MKFFLLVLLVTVNALNIVVSTKDSWVSKNVRFLYHSLKEANHTVVLAAPKYHNPNNYHDKKRDVADSDGGDFGHLLPAHQTYFKNIKMVNTIPKGAKNMVRQADEETFLESLPLPVCSNIYGQDPLDMDAWYVDSSPLESLLITLDVILPQYYPDFQPDLVILGPNEGLNLTPEDGADIDMFVGGEDQSLEDSLAAMMKLCQVKQLPVLAASTEDDHRIYFQNEKYFRIQRNSLADNLSKTNIFSQNIKFINHKINTLLEKLQGTEFFTEKLALNVNFPSINHHDSHCITKGLDSQTNPNFKLLQTTPQEINTSLPQYALVDNEVTVVGNYRMQRRYQAKVDAEASTFVDKRSYYYMQTVKNYAKSALADPEPETHANLAERSTDVSDNQDVNAVLKNSNEYKMLKSCNIIANINLATFDLPGVFTS